MPEEVKSTPQKPFVMPTAELEAAIAPDFITIAPFKFSAPDIPYKGQAGRMFNIKDIKGPALINFWAMWCAPCVEELPSLEGLNKKFPQLEVIAISLDRTDDISSINTFLDQRGIGDFAAHQGNMTEISAAFRLRGIPTTVLIDPQGKVRYVFTGDADWMSEEIISFFSHVLQTKQ